MGFDFDKSSQGDGGGGGKIKRAHRRKMPARSGAGLEPAFLVTAGYGSPTSPQWKLNYSYFIESRNDDAWTYTNTDSTSTVTFSIDSNYWIDLLWVNAGAILSEIALRGTTITRFPGLFAYQAAIVFDVYGYGLSATFKQTGYTQNGGSIYDWDIAPILPRTHITESGSVLFPHALAGGSVSRDI